MGTDADRHRHFEDMAVAHVLGGLDESDGQVFRSHLLQCSDCRAHVGELRALAHELADVERDERRVRAAKSVETKRREDSDEAEEGVASPPQPPRFPRLLIVLGLLVLVGLAGWNLMLRTTVANQQAYVTTVTDGAELLEFGEAVDWTSPMEGIDATIKIGDGQLVLLVVGLDNDSAHAIYQLDGGGGGVASQPVEVTDGRLHYLVSLHEDARRIVVRRSDSNVAEHPSGELLLEAMLPVDR